MTDFAAKIMGSHMLPSSLCLECAQIITAITIYPAFYLIDYILILYSFFDRQSIYQMSSYVQGKKGIWLKLPLGRSELVPIAVKVECITIDLVHIILKCFSSSI